MKLSSTTVLIAAAVVAVAGLIGWVATRPTVSPATVSFAQCLTDKGATMYGAWWCPHCQAQKKLFGTSFEKVKYVECATPDGNGQTQACKDAKIEGYPTWEFSDKSRVSGEQSFAELAKKTGCTVPTP